MTVNDSSRLMLAAFAVVLALCAGAASMGAEAQALKLRLVPAGSGAAGQAFDVELSRWSADAERAPLVAAFAAPPPPPPAAPEGGRAGRAGRGGRGGRGAPPPPSPLARLTTAVKAAPTLGYIWGSGVTGYSIKYAWRSPETGSADRVVLIVDRRLDVNDSDGDGASAAAPDADFTLIEMRIDGKGTGEGKTSLATAVAADQAAQTLALEGYAAAPALLKVSR